MEFVASVAAEPPVKSSTDELSNNAKMKLAETKKRLVNITRQLQDTQATINKESRNNFEL